MAILRGTPSGQCLANSRKCISAGEPKDKPATKGPKPISSSVWNCVEVNGAIIGTRNQCIQPFFVVPYMQHWSMNRQPRHYITYHAGASPKYFIKSFVSTKRLFDSSLDEIASSHNRVRYFIERKCVLSSAHILLPLVRIQLVMVGTHLIRYTRLAWKSGLTAEGR